jgi:hypothetical protein
MSQPLKVAGFELIISGRFWVIAKAISSDSGDNESSVHFYLHSVLRLQ